MKAIWSQASSVLVVEMHGGTNNHGDCEEYTPSMHLFYVTLHVLAIFVDTEFCNVSMCKVTVFFRY